MWRTEGANPLRVQRVNLSGTEDRGSGNLDGGRPVACYLFNSKPRPQFKRFNLKGI